MVEREQLPLYAIRLVAIGPTPAGIANDEGRPMHRSHPGMDGMVGQSYASTAPPIALPLSGRRHHHRRYRYFSPRAAP